MRRFSKRERAQIEEKNAAKRLVKKTHALSGSMNGITVNSKKRSA